MKCPAEPEVRIMEHARLAEYTTFRLGGACPTLFDCCSLSSFRQVWKDLMGGSDPVANPVLIGGGSNLLFRDDGIDRVVVRYVEAHPALERAENVIRVNAGTHLDDLARISAQWGLDGLVMCSGIPGTVGGAIAGNAGAFGEQIGDRIISVEVMNREGEVVERKPEHLGFAYRRSAIPASDDVLLSATLACVEAPPAALMARRQEILDLRATKHPDWRKIPTAGSFFKNIEPTSKAERRQAAGWYLEQAGALTMRVGGARTFERHANIIIAEPGCRAADVIALSEMMAAAVKQKFDLDLEREVKML